MTRSPDLSLDASGLLESDYGALSAEALTVPDGIRLARGGLVTPSLWCSVKTPPQPVPRDLLARFVALVDAGDESFLEFARRFGLLGLCRHGLPWTHNPQCRPRYGERHREPLTRWRAFASAARATLRVAASLHQGERPAIDDLPAAAGPVLLGVGSAGRSAAQHLIQSCVTTWLKFGDVRPIFSWPTGFRARLPGNGQPRVTLGGGSLFAALALQLLMAVSLSDGLAVCSGCNTTYPVHRRPAAGRRNYCPRCRELGRPLRDAQRDRRAGLSKRRKGRHGKAHTQA